MRAAKQRARANGRRAERAGAASSLGKEMIGTASVRPSTAGAGAKLSFLCGGARLFTYIFGSNNGE